MVQLIYPDLTHRLDADAHIFLEFILEVNGDILLVVDEVYALFL